MNKDKKEVIKNLYILGNTAIDIAKEIGEKNETIKKIIDRNFKQEFYEKHLKNRNINQEKIKQLYIDGYTDSQIAKKLKEVKEDTIKKFINRNLGEFNEQHLKNRTKRKEIQEVSRALMNESTKYLGTPQLLKWCNSGFERDSKGNSRFKKGIGARPIDLPAYAKAYTAVI